MASVTGDFFGLDTALQDALQEMADAEGVNINVQSGRRTYEEQVELYQAYLNGTGNLAAKPGTSRHETGLAADITPGREVFGSVASKYGLAFTVSSESWHIELIGEGSGDTLGGAKTSPVAKAVDTATGAAADGALAMGKAIVGLIFDAIGADAARILLYIALVGGGATLVYVGASRAVGMGSTEGAAA